ncbi:MAG: cell division protein FtsA [Pseudomonadota bacterium]
MLKKLILENSRKKNIFTVLDIGTSKIVCLIAKTESGKTSIIGRGCNSAMGFKNGNIIDGKLARESIISALDQAEKMAGLIVEKVILVLNGNKVHSHYLKSSLVIKNKKITNSDVEKLIINSIKDLENQSYEVIHYCPLKYTIDGNSGIKNPIGLLGKHLLANIHFLTIPTLSLENIINCLAACQLDVEDCIFAPHSSGLATLSKHDKEFGSTVIDFGDGITSYALFSQNNMVHCGYLPIGSKSITNDIAKSFMLDISTAERIKTIYGAASVTYADNQKMIKTTDNSLSGLLDNEERSISNAELNEIINARVEEIIYLLKEKIQTQFEAFPDTQHNIILTGGGSMLVGIANEFAKIFGSKIRVKKPTSIDGLTHDSINATYTAAIGAINYIAEKDSPTQLTEVNEHNSIKKIFNWLKKNF